MNWIVKMFLTKSRIKGWVHDGIRAGAKAAKDGNSERLAAIANGGKIVMEAGSAACEVIGDGDYTKDEEAKLDPYVDKIADAILSFFN